MRNRMHLRRTDLLIVVLAALYILSPFDIIPEIVAGPLGLTDDLAAAVLIGTTLMRSRRAAGIDASSAPPEPTDEPLA